MQIICKSNARAQSNNSFHQYVGVVHAALSLVMMRDMFSLATLLVSCIDIWKSSRQQRVTALHLVKDTILNNIIVRYSKGPQETQKDMVMVRVSKGP